MHFYHKLKATALRLFSFQYRFVAASRIPGLRWPLEVELCPLQELASRDQSFLRRTPVPRLYIKFRLANKIILVFGVKVTLEIESSEEGAGSFFHEPFCKIGARLYRRPQSYFPKPTVLRFGQPSSTFVLILSGATLHSKCSCRRPLYPRY